MQNKIYCSARRLDFKRLFYYQYIFLTCLSTRFYVVRGVLDGYHFSSFDSLDKMNLAFNLSNFNNFSSEARASILFKNGSRSFYNLTFFRVWVLCFSFLFSISLAPVLEAFSNNVCPNFHYPYNSNDLLFFLHEVLVNNKSLNYSVCTQISVPLRNFKDSFLNFVPLPQFFLTSFVSYLNLFYSEIFVFESFLEFLLLGLLRLGYVNSICTFLFLKSFNGVLFYF